jgi:type VI secretion system secreted protein VgrG
VHRDYDAASGRFIESDPLGPSVGQANTYAYVDQNPLRFIDPVGLAKHDPSSLQCQRLLDRINGLKREIDQRWGEISSDEGRLPSCIGPGEKRYQTVRGHVSIVNEKDSILRRLENQYDDDCGSPPKCPGTSPQPVPILPPEVAAGIEGAAEAEGATEAAVEVIELMSLIFAE